MTGPFDGVELPRVAVTSYGVELRVPIHEADGITIAVILCNININGRHFGLFLTRDKQGKDPKRPRYFAGCLYTKPATGSAGHTARMADLGDDLYNLTFNGKPVKALWRTIYVVPTPSDLDSGHATTPEGLMINCNPASRFRIPRWLIARFIALQFGVRQIRNTEHHDHDSNKRMRLWAKVDVLLAYMPLRIFPHDCSEDHLDSESWATRSKLFGDADRGVRLSLMPSTRMPGSVLVIHLELLGRVFEEMLHEAGASSLFPSLADLARDTPRPIPSDLVALCQPRSPSQIESTSPQTRSNSSRTPSSDSSRTPSSTSTTASHPRSSRIPRLSPRRLDTRADGDAHGG